MELISIEEILKNYYDLKPDVDNPAEKVSFGTSGHRGEASKKSFNENHIIAITLAIVEYRKAHNIDGLLFVGFDSHLLSLPAFETCIKVLGASNTNYAIDEHITKELLELAKKGQAPKGCAIWTPTPAVSHAILTANKNKTAGLADGIIITPSHNPPSGGGLKYNPINGGAADVDITDWIAKRANELLSEGLANIQQVSLDEAIEKAERFDFRASYIADLKNIIDMDAIRESGLKICADALGGASVDYWSEIAKTYDLNLDVLHDEVDPTFRFVTPDWDGKIRMDCSSPDAMAGTLAYAEQTQEYDLVTGNDTDSDRHGIIARDTDGKYKLMNPNHYLAVAISYLFGGARPEWPDSANIGKTLVSTSMIDKVAENLDKKIYEVPVGIKWFGSGLIDGELGFGGEESAGATFLRKNGEVWTTDKDGIIMALLAAEITVKTGKNPIEIYHDLTNQFGNCWYERVDAAANLEEKAKLKNLTPDQVTAEELAGDPIEMKLTTAPGNGAKIGGLKVSTKNAWFAARPSGTEDIYKIYAESFVSEEHLREVQEAAKEVVANALK